MNFLDVVMCLCGFIGLIGILEISGVIEVDPIKMDPGGRMVRVGFGQNDYRWFFRIDLWFFGIRIT